MSCSSPIPAQQARLTAHSAATSTRHVVTSNRSGSVQRTGRRIAACLRYPLGTLAPRTTFANIVRGAGGASGYVYMGCEWVLRINSPLLVTDCPFIRESNHLQWLLYAERADDRAADGRRRWTLVVARCHSWSAGRVDSPGLTPAVSLPSLAGAAVRPCAPTSHRPPRSVTKLRQRVQLVISDRHARGVPRTLRRLPCP